MQVTPKYVIADLIESLGTQRFLLLCLCAAFPMTSNGDFAVGPVQGDVFMSWQINNTDTSSDRFVVNSAGSTLIFYPASSVTGTVAAAFTNRVRDVGSVSLGNVSFTLLNLTEADASKYLYKIYPGIEVGGQVLVIAGKPNVSAMAMSSPDENKQYTLRCSAKSTSNPPGMGLTMHYQWKNEKDQIITARNRYSFSSDQSDLIINPLKKEDDGIFVCEAWEHVGAVSKSAPFSLTVNAEQGSTTTSRSPTTTVLPPNDTNNTSTSRSPTTTVLPPNDTNNTSTSRSPTGSTVSVTSNTSASTSSTAVSPANNTSNASTAADPTTAEPTATNKTSTSNNGTKDNISDTDTKVIVPAVVVPCGLLIIGAIVLLVFCVRHKARKNVRESPDGVAIQDKDNNIDGWKQSLGHGKATDNIDTVYTKPDGFIIYPGPAAISTARSFKDKKYHGVRDQYSRPDSGTHHHQADYFPSTYTSARAYTHRGKKHHVVTDQYSRPYPDTYGNQTAYFPSTYKSARTYAQKGKTYEGHQPVYNPMATSRLAYDQTAYYPQTGYYGQIGQDVYYSGGGQHSYGQRSRSHHDYNGRKQQREYYSQYEMADYRGNRAEYRRTIQDTAFYY